MESIVAIVIIASSRHLITIDYHHVEPGFIFGAGFVVFVLVAAYVLLKIKPVNFQISSGPNIS